MSTPASTAGRVAVRRPQRGGVLPGRRTRGRGAAYAGWATCASMGDRTQQLVDACATLHRHPAITVSAVSSLYHTAPVGFTAQDWFLNAVACLETTLSPPALLDVTQATERRLGRVPTWRWGPRIV